MEFIQNFLNSFNPTEVFSSLSGFLGSGYIFIAISVCFIFGIIRKLIKLVVFAGICYLFWLGYSSGAFDTFLMEFQGILG